MVSLTVYSVVIFSHRYLDNDLINIKTFVLLAVYWSIWTSSYNADIKVQQFLNGASTMLNNASNLSPADCIINPFSFPVLFYMYIGSDGQHLKMNVHCFTIREDGWMKNPSPRWKKLKMKTWKNLLPVSESMNWRKGVSHWYYMGHLAPSSFFVLIHNASTVNSA